MPRLLIVLLAFDLAVLAWSATGPSDLSTWLMEVAPFLIAAPVMIATARRFPLTPLAYVLIAVHAIILMVGGRYTYAEVPVGFWVKDAFGFARNHYDRLGHFAQGFIPAVVTREILLRTSPLRPGKWLAFLVACVCLAVSAVYELIEWWTAAVQGASADAFLGSQGDIWDAQADMLCALIGAVAALVVLSGLHNRQLRKLGVALVLALACALGAPHAARADYIKDNAADFKTAFTDAEPRDAVDRWLVPFHAPDGVARTSPKAFKVVSTFGSPRQSTLKGHFHTGLDMAPAKRATPRDEILAAANGVVVSIHLADPHMTVVVKHKLKDGSTMFTSYKHLQSARVKVGDQVTPDTVVGVLFTKDEAKKLGGDYDHLHFEVRKAFDDYGVASWATMSKAQLGDRFLDPLAFLKSHLGPVK